MCPIRRSYGTDCTHLSCRSLWSCTENGVDNLISWTKLVWLPINASRIKSKFLIQSAVGKSLWRCSYFILRASAEGADLASLLTCFSLQSLADSQCSDSIFSAHSFRSAPRICRFFVLLSWSCWPFIINKNFTWLLIVGIFLQTILYLTLHCEFNAHLS